LLPSCAGLREIWAPEPPGALRACKGIALLHFVDLRT